MLPFISYQVCVIIVLWQYHLVVQIVYTILVSLCILISLHVMYMKMICITLSKCEDVSDHSPMVCVTEVGETFYLSLPSRRVDPSIGHKTQNLRFAILPATSPLCRGFRLPPCSPFGNLVPVVMCECIWEQKMSRTSPINSLYNHVHTWWVVPENESLRTGN